jgi:hypothetical protein
MMTIWHMFCDCVEGLNEGQNTEEWHPVDD